MKKILIALPNDVLGGAEQYLKNIAIYYLENGWKVQIIFLKKELSKAWNDLRDNNNITLHFTSSKTEIGGVLPLLLTIFSNRKLKYDFVYTSHVHLSGFLGLLRKCRILKTTYFIGRESTQIFDRFSGLKKYRFQFLYYIGYSAIDLLVCQTEYMKDQLLKALPWIGREIKVVVIPNPFAFSLMSQNIGNSYELVLKQYGNYIVTAGRMINEKGFDILLHSFCNLRENNKNIKLVILGDGKDRNYLLELIKTLEIENDVFMPGFVNNVYPYFMYALLCVVPSRVEGFPNVLLQMMSQNNKVVSTKCAGGIEEIEGIFIAEVNDEVSLWTAMELALKTETEKNRQIFDAYLEERSLDKYIKTVNDYLV